MNKDYDLFLEWDESKNNEIFSRIKPDILFRLNPHWVIQSFSHSGESYSIGIADHETSQEKIVGGELTYSRDGIPTVSALEHDWRSLTFFEKNGTLHADVTYPSEPSEELEKHVVLWLRSIKEYLRLYTRTTLNTRFFRFIMNRIILQMNPSQRKISLMLIRLTMLEILVIIIIVVGWFFFFR